MTINFHKWIILVPLASFGLGSICRGEPPDAKSVVRLSELAKLIPLVGEGNSLDPDKWSMIEHALLSRDDASVALAALFLRELATPKADSRLTEIGSDGIAIGPLSSAVVSISLDQIRMRALPLGEQVKHWLKLTTDSSPFVRIEAAKMLAEIDPVAVEAVLVRLESEKGDISSTANRMRRDLAQVLGREMPLPLPGFENPYSIFEHFAGTLINPSREKLVPTASLRQLNRPPEVSHKQETSPQGGIFFAELPVSQSSSTRWPLVSMMVLAAISLLWLWIKKRK